MRRGAILMLVAAVVIGAAGCATMSSQKKGAVIGTTGGALLGGIIGNQAGNTAAGAIIGGAVGGATGAVIGHYMDEQAGEMEKDLEGAKIERVGEGIKVTFDAGILFDVNSAELRPEAKESLAKLATILNKYEDTNVLIEGHTDSDGTESYNQTLSERRASSVSNYLAMGNVRSARMSTIGYGETQPVADNGTIEGKQANRRVEVAIMANEELKKSAEKQAADQNG